MLIFWCPSYGTGKSVLDSLKLEKIGLGNASKERVAVVKTAGNKSIGQRNKCRRGNQFPDSANVTNVIVRRAADSINVLSVG